ncbi:5-(carboxyamino)imidazole ribonucleotide mutase [Candidatus Sumerlaeota bacterium]|nr:5-(carboxyamino)imidazole ribonucleotide mutase [Candidatus Sumerlaeota bacterium]
MPAPKVAILCGSDSDLPTLQACTKILTDFSVPYELKALSAHRTPDDVQAFVRQAEKRGVKVFICAAGMAAHLAGAVAARTTLPVLGIPIASPPFNGMDSLLATVQMPPGVPVMTLAAGKAGAANAALAAIQIFALSSASLRKKLQAHRRKMAVDVRRKNEKLDKLGIDGYVES